GAGFTATELSTEAAVTLEPEGQGFRISRSALTLHAKVPNLDETKFADLARDAETAQSPRFSRPRSCSTPSWPKVHRRSRSVDCAWCGEWFVADCIVSHAVRSPSASKM